MMMVSQSVILFNSPVIIVLEPFQVRVVFCQPVKVLRGVFHWLQEYGYDKVYTPNQAFHLGHFKLQ